ncbi:SPARC-related modular calcium-binding protein 1 isoform X7 [Syngnathoides biaculeatus]|uniref:SPARC-related modular calcium-binding protein 1 isoform X7 n=1 Tax=Syngnathoides biaculeatus TaxID=300417 RepID=UPI002ADE79C6|nr:SPARC-related modular calcium-binding protein 1 isoform X7 [Syngnathoides biaculeatus]
MLSQPILARNSFRRLLEVLVTGFHPFRETVFTVYHEECGRFSHVGLVSSCQKIGSGLFDRFSSCVVLHLFILSHEDSGRLVVLRRGHLRIVETKHERRRRRRFVFVFFPLQPANDVLRHRRRVTGINHVPYTFAGNFHQFLETHVGTSGLTGSVTDRPPGPANSGRKDDGSKPTPTMETVVPSEGDEITAPTLWIKQLVYKENKQNSSASRKQEKVPSCDQERQSALDEARQNPREAVFIPDCGPGGLYKAVQCHQSTGYCWCVLVDTGRPIPGTSTRYQTPECDSVAHSRGSDAEDLFQGRDLTGCPDGKKGEFITSLLDALTTDMVQAINSPAPSSGGRFAEPDPSHTLEERVVHWYFAQLDANGSQDVGKKELKPFKRYLKKKAKPKKCARKFTDYCDLNKDKAISLHELKGCLGVAKDGGSTASSVYGTSTSSGLRGERSRSRDEGRGHRKKASTRPLDGDKKE